MKKCICMIMIFCGVFFIQTSLFATEELFEGYRILHDARLGKEGAVEKSVAFFEKYHNEHPEDMFGLVLLGCSYGAKAADSGAPWSKMKWGNKGFKTIEDAYIGDKTNLWIRFERALAFLRAPAIAKKQQAAYEEFVGLAKDIAAMDTTVVFSIHGVEAYYSGTISKEEFLSFIQQRILFLTGVACQKVDKNEDAQRYWKEVVAIATDSEYGKRAIEQLEKMNKE